MSFTFSFTLPAASANSRAGVSAEARGGLSPGSVDR